PRIRGIVVPQKAAIWWLRSHLSHVRKTLARSESRPWRGKTFLATRGRNSGQNFVQVPYAIQMFGSLPDQQAFQPEMHVHKYYLDQNPCWGIPCGGRTIFIVMRLMTVPPLA